MGYVRSYKFREILEVSKTFADSIIFFFILISCNNNSQLEEPITLTPTIINDNLPTNFPRELKIDDKYFYTPTVLSNFAIGIFNLNSGEVIAGAVRIGKGPKEFITPQISQIYNDQLLISDVNKNQQALFRLKDALEGNNECYLFPKVDFVNYTRVLIIDKDNLVYLTPDNDKLFYHLKNDSLIKFGEKFLRVNEQSQYTLFQGELAYHFTHRKLVYGNIFLPYISTFDFMNGSFTPSNQTIKSGKKLKYDKKRIGIGALTLTKDYIVCLQRDYKIDRTDESTVGRDYSKLCKTVFLYDFNCKLVKIINLQYPVIRIASVQENNDIVAIIFRQNKFQVVNFHIPDKD